MQVHLKPGLVLEMRKVVKCFQLDLENRVISKRNFTVKLLKEVTPIFLTSAILT